MGEPTAIIKASPLKKRRILNWINVAVMSVLLLGLLILANVIVNTYPVRKDVTIDKLWEVSDHSKKVARNLREKLTVYTTRFVEGPYANDKSLQTAWQQVGYFLEEFSAVNPTRIAVQPVHERMENWKDFVALFPNHAYNQIHIATKADDGKPATKVFNIYELFQGNPQSGEISDFAAEPRIVAAVIQLTTARRKVVYHVTNHKEITVPGTDRMGMSLVVSKLKEFDNVEFKPLDLGRDKAVPRDADVVFIAGPQVDFDLAEIDALRTYWRGGGRLFVGLVYQPDLLSNFKAFVEDCGAYLNRDLLIDQNAPTGAAVVQRVLGFPSNPINIEMAGRAIDLPYTASIDMSPKRPTVRSHPLMFVKSPTVWAETDLRPNVAPRPETGEKQGEITVAVWSEESVEKPVDAERQTARLIAWGGVDAMRNVNIAPFNSVNQGALEYILNNFRWLLSRESHIAAAPKAPRQLKPLSLTPEGARVVSWISIGGLPFLGVMLGVVAWIFRRK